MEPLINILEGLGDPPNPTKQTKFKPTSVSHMAKYANNKSPEYETPEVPQRCFIIIKPGFEGYAWRIIDMFQKEGFRFVEMKTTKLTLRQAQKIYAVHKDEDFYKPLCKYMSSGISTGISFIRPKGHSTEKIFKLVDELKDKIRKKWSESDMRNVMHSSDSPEAMEKESSIYFGI
jgi:nucleoside-diphosphate kinase